MAVREAVRNVDIRCLDMIERDSRETGLGQEMMSRTSQTRRISAHRQRHRIYKGSPYPGNKPGRVHGAEGGGRIAGVGKDGGGGVLGVQERTVPKHMAAFASHLAAVRKLVQ